MRARQPCRILRYLNAVTALFAKQKIFVRLRRCLAHGILLNVIAHTQGFISNPYPARLRISAVHNSPHRFGGKNQRVLFVIVHGFFTG